MSPLELCQAAAASLDAAKAGSPMDTAVIVAEILPIYDLADLDVTQVAVAPFSRSKEPAARRSVSTKDVTIAVGISRRAKLTNTGAIEATLAASFLAFVEWADDHLESVRSLGPYSWVASDLNPLYDAAVLQDRNVFRSIINVTYRVVS